MIVPIEYVVGEWETETFNDKNIEIENRTNCLDLKTDQKLDLQAATSQVNTRAFLGVDPGLLFCKNIMLWRIAYHYDDEPDVLAVRVIMDQPPVWQLRCEFIERASLAFNQFYIPSDIPGRYEREMLALYPLFDFAAFFGFSELEPTPR